jgi:hypothetical protein
MREEALPSVEDLQEIVNMLRSETESLRNELPMKNKVFRKPRAHRCAIFLKQQDVELSVTLQLSSLLTRLNSAFLEFQVSLLRPETDSNGCATLK